MWNRESSLNRMNFNKSFFTFLYIYRHFYKIVINIYKENKKKTSVHNFWKHARIHRLCNDQRLKIKETIKPFDLTAQSCQPELFVSGSDLDTAKSNNALSRPFYRKIFGTTTDILVTFVRRAPIHEPFGKEVTAPFDLWFICGDKCCTTITKNVPKCHDTIDIWLSRRQFQTWVMNCWIKV